MTVRRARPPPRPAWPGSSAGCPASARSRLPARPCGEDRVRRGDPDQAARPEAGDEPRSGQALQDHGDCVISRESWTSTHLWHLETTRARIGTDAGLTGWDEAFSPVSRRTTRTILEDLFRIAVLGEDSLDIAYLLYCRAMRERGHGGGAAAAPPDRRPRPGPHEGPCRLGRQRSGRHGAHREGSRGHGYGALKLHLRVENAAIVEIAAAVRRQVGNGVELRVDVQVTRDVSAAITPGRGRNACACAGSRRPSAPRKRTAMPRSRALNLQVASGAGQRTAWERRPRLERRAIDRARPVGQESPKAAASHGSATRSTCRSRPKSAPAACWRSPPGCSSRRRSRGSATSAPLPEPGSSRCRRGSADDPPDRGRAHPDLKVGLRVVRGRGAAGRRHCLGAPGARIVEAKIAGALGVSRVPVREALQRLHLRGILAPGGLRVADFDPGHIAQTFGLRHAIERVILHDILRAGRDRRQVIVPLGAAVAEMRGLAGCSRPHRRGAPARGSGRLLRGWLRCRDRRRPAAPFQRPGGWRARHCGRPGASPMTRGRPPDRHGHRPGSRAPRRRPARGRHRPSGGRGRRHRDRRGWRHRRGAGSLCAPTGSTCSSMTPASST